MELASASTRFTKSVLLMSFIRLRCSAKADCCKLELGTGWAKNNLLMQYQIINYQQ